MASGENDHWGRVEYHGPVVYLTADQLGQPVIGHYSPSARRPDACFGTYKGPSVQLSRS